MGDTWPQSRGAVAGSLYNLVSGVKPRLWDGLLRAASAPSKPCCRTSARAKNQVRLPCGPSCPAKCMVENHSEHCSNKASAPLFVGGSAVRWEREELRARLREISLLAGWGASVV